MPKKVWILPVLFIIFILVLVVGGIANAGEGFTENGFDLILKNDTEAKQVAWLHILVPETMQWMNLYTGEIQPGAVEKLEHKYEPGNYIVAWEGEKEGRIVMFVFVQYKFIAEKTHRKLTFTPDGLIHVAWNGI